MAGNHALTAPIYETVTEVAIRVVRYNGEYSYMTHTEYGIRNPPPSVPLTLETAENQIGMYRKDCEPTIVTRKVVKIIDPWEEVTRNARLT